MSVSRVRILSLLFVPAVVALACAPAKDDDEGAGGAAGSTNQPSAGTSAGGTGGAGGQSTAGAAGAGDAGAAGAGATGGSNAGASAGGTAGAAGTANGGTAGTAGSGAAGTSAGGNAGSNAGGSAGSNAGGSAGSNAGGSAGSNAGGNAGSNAGGSSGAAGSSSGALSWKGYGSPCGGNKINALWFDDTERGFAGCGENANGKGLFTTTDGGKTWSAQPKLGEVRVLDLRRGSDGVLYGAGTHTVEGFSLFSLDETAPKNLKPVGLYTPSNQAFKSVAIGENAARTADGKIMVDTLVGGAVALALPGKEYVEYSTLHEDQIADANTVSGFAPRRIKTLGNDFYAVGNKINESATIFLPSKKTSPAYHFVPLQLQPETQDGEPYDLHVWSATSIMVVGWDQSYQYPLIFVCNGDPYVKTSWRQVDLLDAGITYKGGVNGLAVVGDKVVLVGTKIPSNDGFVLESPDKGTTWKDITPAGKEGPIEAMYRAQAFADGRIIVAGGAEAYVYAP